MIVLAPTAVGVASALFTLERLRRLARLELRHLWLVWVAIAAQIVLLAHIAPNISLGLGGVLHLATFAPCLVFLWHNRQLPGISLIASGATCNLVAIAANGGTMPADAHAWRAAGLPDVDPDVFTNSRALLEPRLAVLGDIFYIPAGWPLSNVFSIGDVLLVVGGTYLAHAWCRRPVPTERLELSLTRT